MRARRERETADAAARTAAWEARRGGGGTGTVAIASPRAATSTLHTGGVDGSENGKYLFPMSLFRSAIPFPWVETVHVR
jgi:hypothetical protein